MSDEDEGFQEPTAPAWMATFGDLMSLLLTFFVLLLSFASMDAKRFAEVSGSVRDAFGVQRVYPGKIEVMSDDLISLTNRENSSMLQPVADYDGKEQMRRLQRRIEMTLQSLRLDKLIEVSESAQGIVVRVPGQLLFDAGSTELRPEALLFLRELAGLIQETPERVAIEGHTDSTGGRSDLANWKISGDRALAALRYLVEVGDVDPARLQVVARADTRPVAPNDREENRQKNRRVEIVFLRPDPAVRADADPAAAAAPQLDPAAAEAPQLAPDETAGKKLPPDVSP